MEINKLEKEATLSVEEAYLRIKSLFKFRYHKIALLVLTIIASYLFFTHPSSSPFLSYLENYGYLTVFIAGILFSFGFTTPIAIAIFLSIHPSNIILAAILGGVGAMLSDLLIFKIIRVSLADEFTLLEKTKPLLAISSLIKKSLPHKIRVYILYAFAGIIIASPLPDELGVTMLAGLTQIKAKVLSIISFICNTLGILILLSIF